jgi:hypothetical protein
MAGANSPNIILKTHSKQNLVTYINDHFTRPMASKGLLFKFSNSITQTGAIQALSHNKLKPHQNPCCDTPDTPIATRRPLVLNVWNENPNRI